MHRVGASDGRRRCLREPEEAHLAGVDQARHCADGVLDRDFRVDTMLVVKVDHVHAETLEALVARARHVLRSAVDAGGAVGLAHVAELRGEHHAVAPSAQRLAEQRLVVAPAIHVGGIQKVHAEVERALNHTDGLRVVARAVRARHRHASEADRADLERATAQPPSLDHGCPSVALRVRGMVTRRIVTPCWRYVRAASCATVTCRQIPPRR